MDVLVEEERFRLIGGTRLDRRAVFAEDVRRGLRGRPRSVPPFHLYDDEGSRLFEEICDLPEYYLTRTEAGILRACASEVVELMQPPTDVIELGSGSADKTQILLSAFLQRRGRLCFSPIDVASEILERSSRRLLDKFAGLTVTAFAGEYVEGLTELLHRDSPSGGRTGRLVLWLGSSVGNMTREGAASFLKDLGVQLGPGDALLLGVDHRKDKGELVAAYDDARGVSALFAKNLLVRINRELGGTFEVGNFDYLADYDEEQGFVDMQLIARRACEVDIEALGLRVSFEEGEALQTESSYKYSRAEIDRLASESGLRVARSWSDEQDRFSLNLFVP